MLRLLAILGAEALMVSCGGSDEALPDAAGSSADADPGAPDADQGAPDADPAAPDAIVADAPASPYPLHIITGDCAPNDAPALRLSLGSEVDANCHLQGMDATVEILLWVSDVSAPATIVFSPSNPLGSGTICPGGLAPCRVSESGEVHFETFSKSTGATGTWKLVFGESTEQGSFEADWCTPSDPVMCG